MKLGEILIEQHVLTEQQLEMALKSQLIYGGHLGTSLIELGLVDEDTLGRVLARATGVPYARPHLFADISAPTINAVPGKIAEEYEAVPLRLADKAVHLALVNPRNLHVLDELSFAIGRRVIPWIAPEVRVLEALERYYGVRRRPRYITLAIQLNEAGEHGSSGTETISRDLEGAEPVPGNDPEDVDLFSTEGHDVSFGYGRSWHDVADELEIREAAAPAAESAQKASSPRSPLSAMSLPELAERYCQADSRDDLARAALDFGIGRAERMLLMIVRANRASVWDERGFSLADATRNGVAVDVTSEALFHLPMGSDHFHGALPPREELRAFYRRLGSDTPAELLLIPIHVNDQLVAAVLADGGREGRVRGEIDEILKAFRLFATAIGMVALRKKIRDAARPATRAPGA